MSHFNTKHKSKPMSRSIKLWFNSQENDVKVRWSSQQTPITVKYMERLFRRDDAPNCGNLERWKLNFNEYVHRSITIAKWVKNNPASESEPQPWKVFLDGTDVCNVYYQEQLISLLHGLGIKMLSKAGVSN